MQSLRIAFRNVVRQRKRALLLGGAIAFGVLVITLIGSFTSGAVRNVRQNFTGIFGGHIYVSGRELSPSGRVLGRIGDRRILEQAVAAIRDDVAGLRARSRARGEVVFASRQEPLAVEGVDWAAEAALWDDLGVTRGERSLLTREDAVLLPSAAAEALGVQVGETILFRLSTITGQANVGEFTVAGVYPGNRDFNLSGAYAGLPHVNRLLGLGPQEYQVLNLTLRDMARIEAASAALYGELERLGRVEPQQAAPGPGGRMHGMVMSMMTGGVSSLAGDEEAWAGTKFSIATLNDLMDPVLALVRTLDMLRMGLFAVLLVITMVGLLNSFRMVLLERTQEIGTLRALGMQRGGIRGTFLFEALFLALAGSACGLAASLLGMVLLGRVPLAADGLLQFFARSGRLSFPFVPADVAATVITLAAVTVLSAWLPARKASRLEPAAALRTAY